ncbi:tryptophan synthase subunit alpha [Amycolatopsis roodepoortensis]|uniref:tryptophan synthase subunit alpha n=1 Tax=Amycolatopsis roodepoortensis TaxID=700274 RepID=UPI00214C4418|nr:tryptophan synthase subunit alpha [Amycolatopsis roodepoortensis]UUV29035.1 tryptophan synthase subunit alpha [Amycolatopsis roodepoortensis]
MPHVGERFRESRSRDEALLVVYLTVGDPIVPFEALARAVVEAGADVLELGVPTEGTRPRGAEVARSFERVGDLPAVRSWEMVGKLRAALPETPLLQLVYPATTADLGVSPLLAEAAAAGLDGLVLTDPSNAPSIGRVLDRGLSAIPLITSSTEPARAARLEAEADVLTYRSLAARTGDPLTPAEAGRLTEAAAGGAGRPFLAGFGLRDEAGVRAVARHAAGVVIGSELYRVLGATGGAPLDRVRDAVTRWKAATVRTSTESRA